MPPAAFIYESALSQHVLRQDHPMRPARLRHTYQLLQAYGAFEAAGKSLASAPVAFGSTGPALTGPT